MGLWDIVEGIGEILASKKDEYDSKAYSMVAEKAKEKGNYSAAKSYSQEANNLRASSRDHMRSGKDLIRNARNNDDD